ncbi:unnamed protein product (macronuclear) [Paramecium tetraurelia]|uniref:Uncharacterized protein n=1 Tax=Paramecium tetraurelia TaxID=5888 RepID=A0D6C8_PARTE|nr:uncharacterized protein GSPATT00001636001 [Paramecium tetraurelia]CAK78595.1 unnamed protein product [Paramecium tetraurelia]|eukprot:XP_001445992.1 hypothetical protein (macronuclear) [Paramecium tetraurelia strain d4-2]
MKVTITLLVVLALANAGMVQKFPLTYGGKRSLMNIMVEVENKIKSHSPLDTIKGVLDNFKSAVAQEQGTHDEVYTAQLAECESEISYRRAEVEDSVGTLKIANGILKTSNILLTKTQATLGETENILNSVSLHIDLINDVRKEDTQSYNRGAVTFNDAINAIDDGIDLGVALVKGEASLIQVADMTTKLMMASVATKMNKAFMAPLAALASIKQEEDAAGAAERLVQLLQTLRSNVEEAWASYTTENTKALALFTQQKDLYLATQGRLSDSKDKLVIKAENLQGVISVQTAIAQAATNKKQRNQTLWDDAADLCHSFDVEYEAVTEGRRQELILVQELERAVERRAAEQI